MNRFKKEFIEHEKEMSKFTKLERFAIRLIPFMFSFAMMYALTLFL